MLAIGFADPLGRSWRGARLSSGAGDTRCLGTPASEWRHLDGSLYRSSGFARRAAGGTLPAHLQQRAAELERREHGVARGETPASLEATLAAGIMDAFYLQDENRLPLIARLEADCFVVESSGPSAWRHAWQGLDARR